MKKKLVYLSFFGFVFMSANIVFAQSNKLQSDAIVRTTTQMPKPAYDISKYLSENIKYPKAAEKNKVDGTVLIEFVVAANGEITNAVALTNPDPSLTKEAIRVIKNMPKWEPGRDENGKAVATYYKVPVTFRLKS